MEMQQKLFKRLAPVFAVTFETITPESAEQGDFATNGFVAEGLTLRDALAELDNFNRSDNPPEADECPVSFPRWITVYGAVDAWGEVENRSIHFPEELSQGSRMRIARLLGCYGIPK